MKIDTKRKVAGKFYEQFKDYVEDDDRTDDPEVHITVTDDNRINTSLKGQPAAIINVLVSAIYSSLKKMEVEDAGKEIFETFYEVAENALSNPLPEEDELLSLFNKIVNRAHPEEHELLSLLNKIVSRAQYVHGNTDETNGKTDD